MAQLKENFYRIVKRDKKVQILMALPNSWSIRKIHTSSKPQITVWNPKKLVAKKGFLSSLNIKPDKLCPLQQLKIISQQRYNFQTLKKNLPAYS
jgi:hypothetical protein